jgi:hypothetical protein
MIANTHRVPESACPKCGEPLDTVGCATDLDESPPAHGDLTICLDCGTVLCFEADLQLRTATAAEIAEGPPELADFAAALHAQPSAS